MFETFKVDRKNISDTVVEYIKNLIHEKKFQPGEKIPGERELAQLMNVSRNTIREAYKILAAQGYVNIKHGNGVFISDAETQLTYLTSSFFMESDHIHELFAIRKVLETQSVKWVIDNYHEEYKQELLEMVEETRLALKQKDIDRLAELDLHFHITLTRMSGNSILLRIMMNLIDLLTEARTESIQIPDRVQQSYKEHREIVEAIIGKDRQSAEQLMMQHLNSVEISLIQKQLSKRG